MPMSDAILILAEGRRLGVAQFGDPGGAPVFYAHGFPGSRLEAALTHAAAASLGLRIIALDRPGYGRSEAQGGRTIGDWAFDVAAVAEQFSIGRFALLGVSGGAPYALGCARALGDRVTRLALVGGLCPLDDPTLLGQMGWPARLSFSLGRRLPRLAKSLHTLLVSGLLQRHPERVMALLTVSSPPADSEVLADPPTWETLVGSIAEGVRPGAAGAVRDLHLYGRPWGFDLSAISLPVSLWHGEADATVPVAMGRLLASQLPDCRARFLAGEGHFSVPVRYMGEILAGLAEELVPGN